jgi:hypothetical protein
MIPEDSGEDPPLIIGRRQDVLEMGAEARASEQPRAE